MQQLEVCARRLSSAGSRGAAEEVVGVDSGRGPGRGPHLYGWAQLDVVVLVIDLYDCFAEHGAD